MDTCHITPNYEAIIVARKPCESSCVENVMKYGTGGLNIDGCRVGDEKRTYKGAGSSPQKIDNHEKGDTGIGMLDGSGKDLEFTVNGRYPANVILTYDDIDQEEVCRGMPNIGSGNNGTPYNYAGREYNNKDSSMFNGDKPKAPSNYNDNGSVARYYYCAKYNDRDQEQVQYEVDPMENSAEQKIHLFSQGSAYQLYQGSMLDMLDVIEPNSIDAIVTDPPYELNFMNKGWDNSGIAFQKETWEKCFQVLKPGGHLLAFGGTRTFHRIACAIEDAGFEIRDTIMWLYGSGFPKSLNISLAIDKKNGVESELGNIKPGHEDFANRTTDGDTRFEGGMDGFDRPWMHDPEKREAYHYEKLPTSEEAKRWQGWGTSLKPAYEPIVVARKPVVGNTTDNVMEYGVGGINIDECRVPLEADYVYKETNRKPRSNNVFTDETCGFNSEDNHTAVADPKGRYPANLVLTYDETDADEVCGGMPNTISTGGSGEASKINTFSNAYNGGWGHDKNCANLGGLGDSGSAARYFYTAKASKRDRDEGLAGFDEQKCSMMATNANIDADGNFTGMLAGRETARKNIHPTVKPTALMQYLIRLVTPKGGTILDPFNGSGSTGKAAMYENNDRNSRYKYIGIELTPEYLPISEARITYAINAKDNIPEQPISASKEKMMKNQMNLFDLP